MADYYSIITNRGKELEAEALASGRLIVLTHFVVGDSNGKQVKPDPAQIRLINETFRGDIAEMVVSPEQSTQLMAKIVLPTGVGGFTVREVGLMTDAGELYAVANCPSFDKPVGGVSVNMQFRLAVSDTSNITLNVATGDGLFLRIDQNLKEIKVRGAEAQKTSRESIGVLDGTTQQRGLVQLNSAVNSTSETQAATPAAIKIVMDNASARLAKDRNGADIPNVALFLQNIGLVETIAKAARSVDKNGDTMTGPLGMDGAGIRLNAIDSRNPQYTIFNGVTGADMGMDLLGDTVRIYGRSSRLAPYKNVILNLVDGSLSAPGSLKAGKAEMSDDGNISGTIWGVNGASGWLSNYLTSRFQGIQNQFSAIPVDNGSGNIHGSQWDNDWLSNYINKRFAAVANQFVHLGGQNGYFKDVTTGFLVQFGRLQSVTGAEETSGYNIAFPNQCLGVLAVVGTNINAGVTVYASPVNNQGFAYKTSAGLVGFTWFAWGK
ncbi:phage tail protein [Citrobacter braakii]|uniref:phage tail protein n=1 Tax=Citrobacter braakii TaxID=57706 RepID=UPI001F1BE8D0|nr:phage tail protein [Citrobacter braakii]